MQKKITHLFCDVGGVLLSNGWDRYARARAAEKFMLEREKFEETHKLFFDTYELGKITLNDYLQHVVFFNKRSFSADDFASYMYAQTTGHDDMLAFIPKLKKENNLVVATVNNEGKELNAYRITHFGLKDFVDFFVSSGLVHLRKPDVDIWKLALDIAQVEPENVVYLDDRIELVEIARSLSMHAIHHTHIDNTKKEMIDLGLRV